MTSRISKEADIEEYIRQTEDFMLPPLDSYDENTIESLNRLIKQMNPKETFGEKIVNTITDMVEASGPGISYRDGEVTISYTKKF